MLAETQFKVLRSEKLKEKVVKWGQNVISPLKQLVCNSSFGIEALRTEREWFPLDEIMFGDQCINYKMLVQSQKISVVSFQPKEESVPTYYEMGY